MTLEQLRLFVEVAEREHVTAAARALNLTQSAVSNAIAALETRHGVQLFDRVGRGIVVNETGRQFLIEARQVLARAGQAEAALNDLAGLRRGTLTLFASQTVAGYWLPRRMVAFREAYPGIDLHLRIGNSEQAERAIIEGVAELGFIEGEIDEPRLHQSVVDEDRMVVLVPPDHPWNRDTPLSAAELPTQPWVLREKGSGTRSSLEAAMTAQGVDPALLKPAMTLPSNECVLGAAEAGAGATALSESVARAALATGTLVTAPIVLPSRRFHMLRHRERPGSRASRAFADLVRAGGDGPAS
ncbi:LysR family transcriptional regulator [Sphingobium amiense]|uniref:LysR family transcriptional regulator n=1 Tax=Sphingobium amiense TaxID=135719 RepID=A0A494W9C8_9SPHN|nr:LysR family transcriptional regulator [Sphingobium amiense]BBD96799.1 LysR family transcriptional regulator [Sphingobium amiense]